MVQNPGSERPGELTFSVFVGILTATVPGLPDQLGPEFRIDRRGPLGSFQRAGIRRAVQSLAGDPPEGLVESIETLGAAYEWLGIREGAIAGHAGTIAPVGRERYATAEVRLRALSPEDFGPLYQLAVDPAQAYKWRFRGATPSFQQYMQSSYEGTLAQFAVEDNRSGLLCGMVAAYNASLDSGHVYVALQRAETGAARRGQMTVGGMLMIDYLFRTWSLHKIYFEVPGYNLEAFFSETGGLLEEEACLKDHLYHAGERHSMYHLALYRSKWETVSELLWP